MNRYLVLFRGGVPVVCGRIPASNDALEFATVTQRARIATARRWYVVEASSAYRARTCVAVALNATEVEPRMWGRIVACEAVSKCATCDGAGARQSGALCPECDA